MDQLTASSHFFERRNGETASLIQALHELMDIADPQALSGFRCATSVGNKSVSGGFDPVTEIDLKIERALRSAIETRFPHDGIHGEELGAVRPQASRRWYIDPIDGTRAYMCGSPTWGTLIGVCDDGRMIAGMLSHPLGRERFFGTGVCAWHQSHSAVRRLKVRPVNQLERAKLSCTDPAMFAGTPHLERFDALSRSVRLVRYGMDCLGYAMVAAGHLDLVVERDCKPVDVLPLLPIVEGAGGVIVNARGEISNMENYVVAAASAELAALAIQRMFADE